MTEDEKEALVYRLWEEFSGSLSTVTNEMKFAFIAGARSAIYTLSFENCQKCGCSTGGEKAIIDGAIWCHPCADKRGMGE